MDLETKKALTMSNAAIVNARQTMARQPVITDSFTQEKIGVLRATGLNESQEAIVNEIIECFHSEREIADKFIQALSLHINVSNSALGSLGYPVIEKSSAIQQGDVDTHEGEFKL